MVINNTSMVATITHAVLPLFKVGAVAVTTSATTVVSAFDAIVSTAIVSCA